MNIKIVNYPDEGKITFQQAFLRELPYAIILFIDIIITFIAYLSPDIYNSFIVQLFVSWSDSAQSMWFLVEIITMLVNDQRRAVHDLIARTVVIKTQ